MLIISSFQHNLKRYDVRSNAILFEKNNKGHEIIIAYEV